MLIFKYLTKEVLSALLAITFVLMLIFMSTQFVHYLGDAAFGGRYSAAIVFHIMILQIPYLLGLLLPLGFYLAILVAYGRLHADREMLVLHSCGFSDGKLLSNTLIMALVIAAIVAILTCGIAPYVAKAQEELVTKAQSEPLIETIMPGRFYSLNDGRDVFYTEAVSRDHRVIKNIFIATQNKADQQTDPNNWSVISAKQAYQVLGKKHLLIAQDGNRYQGIPGAKEFQSQHFEKLSWLIAGKNVNINNSPAFLPFSTLLKEGRKNPQNVAELQWRLSLPLSVILLTLLALPLCKVNPRQGKFAQFLPAVLIYIFYANMMFVGRSWIESGTLPPAIGLWWLHGCLLLVAVGITFFRSRWSTLVWKKIFKG